MTLYRRRLLGILYPCVVSLVLFGLMVSKHGSSKERRRTTEPGMLVATHSNRSCERAPYLYVTFHGGKQGEGINQVHRYSRDGCFLGEVLSMKPAVDFNNTDAEPPKLRELRGTVESQHTGELYVANAWKGASAILVFEACSGALQKRSKKRTPNTPLPPRAFHRVLATQASNAAVYHPYGLASHQQNVYASSQDSNAVVGLNSITGLPVPSKTENLTKGVIFAASVDAGGLRGVAFDDNGRLFAATRNAGVMVVEKSGRISHHIPIMDSIGVNYSPQERLMFVGSPNEKSVFALDVDGMKIVKTYTAEGMAHPAGITSFGGVLYVAGHDTRLVYKWEIESMEFLGSFAVGGGDALEDLNLGSC